MFRTPLETAFLDALRATTNGGWALGDDRFKQQIAHALRCRAAGPPAPSVTSAGLIYSDPVFEALKKAKGEGGRLGRSADTAPRAIAFQSSRLVIVGAAR